MRRHDLKRGVIVLFMILFVSLILINFTRAFGISTPYLENDTLKVKAGQSYEYPITIQNGDEQGYYVDINYSSTDNVATLRNTTYFVPLNTYNNTFFFDIIIPKNISIGKTYSLEYSAKPKINETAPVILGVEIKRSIIILVTDENGTSSIPSVPTPVIETKNKKTSGTGQTIGKYLLIIIIILLFGAIINRVWRLSKGISLKIGNGRVTNYTISQAINLNEVRVLLEKITDEEYKLPEIRNIFKDKMAELTKKEFAKDVREMSRREVIDAIKKDDK